MKRTECQVVIDDRTVILSLASDQLAVRQEGDLITAEIVAVAPNPNPTEQP